LTRDGAVIPLGPTTPLTGSGNNFSLDLSAATASAGNYVLTLNPSDIQDLVGNPLASGATQGWQIAGSATTTILTANPNATTGGQLVTFTATVTPSPGNAGSVTFEDNGVAIDSFTGLVAGVAT